MYALLFTVPILAACDHQTSLIDPGATDTATADGGGGIVQRATLIVNVELTGGDSTLAERIGSAGGVLTHAEVRISREGGSDSVRSATTDASGRVQFEGLLPGRYGISVLRRLSPEEIDRLGPGNEDLTGFGGAEEESVRPPATEVTIDAVAGRRGSVVISEAFFARPRVEGGQASSYPLGQYLEVYNNADTTTYLAGKIIFKSIVWVRDFTGTPRSCDDMARWRLDPEGLWSQWIWAFPGSGQQHPLAPGETAVIATDAIDHTEIKEGLLDLRNVDFEFMGPNDVNNPRVPDMITLGDHWQPALWGHGLFFTPINEILGVAENVEVDALVSDDLPVNDPLFWRIPAEKILDVLTAVPVPEVNASLTPLCTEIVNPKFDRAPAPLIDSEALNTIHRRVLAVLADGRPTLQRTGTSARDFEARSPSPNSIPR